MADELVTFGEAMVLLLAEPGVPLRSATSFRRSVAGAESNVAVGPAHLGHRVGWFGPVGADLFGEVVLAALRAENVDVSRAIVDEEASTGLLLRDCHPERPIEVVYPNVRRKLLAPEEAVRRMRPVVEMADVVLAGMERRP